MDQLLAQDRFSIELGQPQDHFHPFTTTETFGRGGFFIHGGSVPGSKGCIDLTDDMDRFTDDLMREVGAAQNCQIHLTIEYPRPGDYDVPRTDLRWASADFSQRRPAHTLS